MFGALTFAEREILFNFDISDGDVKVTKLHFDCSKEEISNKREQMVKIIRGNTQRLEEMGMLVSEHNLFQEGLDKRQKDVVSMCVCVCV